jgi:hypothetical protein
MAKLRVRSASLALAAVLAFTVACSSDDDTDGDARAATPSPDARCPIVTRGGGCRAAGPNERVTIASGGLLLPAAGFVIDESGAYLAFAVRWGDGRILSSKSDPAWAFEPASAMPWALANGATGVTTAGRSALFFLAQAQGPFGLYRAPIESGALGPPTPVVLDGAEGALNWPQAVGLADGRTLLTFVVPQREVKIGVDDGTGTRFDMRPVPLSEPDLSGVLAHVGTTARGSWVLTYQVADAGWRFRSHVILSRDEGATWSDANAGRLDDGDVQDAFPLARKDEGADVYYVRHESRVQTVWRRALHEDGSLGPAQEVTSDKLGSLAKPQPRRLPDGRIAMMFSTLRSVKESELALLVLDGDAP